MIENLSGTDQKDRQRAKRMGIAPSARLRRHFLALARQSRHWFDNRPSTGQTRSIGVTSLGEGVGTSTIAYNLSVSLTSLARCRTLLVETNFGKHFITRRMGNARNPGFSEVLTGMAEMEDSVVETPIAGLNVLGCGQVTEQFALELPFDELPETINRCFLDYQYTVFDLPSANHLTACYSIVPNLDGVILAVDASQIDHRQIKRFRRMMDSLDVEIIGLVINKQ